MSRLPMMLFAGLVACGGGPKKQADQPVLPPDPAPVAKAAPKPDPEPAAKSEPAKPPEALKPADVSLPLGETTVKLVSAGTGKKEKLAYAPKPDAKQHVEIAMDLRAKQDSEDDVSPTMVIIGDATAKKDPSGGYAVLLSVTDANAKDAPGSKLPAAQLQAALGSLIGMTIAQLTQPNGTAKELALHIEKPDGMTGSALQVLDLAWPNGVALPAEPVGVGAKWDATMKTHLAQKLDVTRVTTYELVSHTGNVWKLKETTKVTGPDQEIEGAKATDIAGTGTGELTLTDGAIYPTGNTQGETHFTVASADKKVVLSITTGAKITTK